ncbi:MAG: hypothetical protein H0V56_10945 [Chthoniobacterales bacterium]|nr:hypothetical protein [Chthoniobacterales bacterium]
MVDFIRDAEVVIADSQYNIAEYPSRRGWGHTCAEDTVQMALRGHVRRLFLFHHDPDRTDENLDALVERQRERVEQSGQTLRISAAREGEEVVLENRDGPDRKLLRQSAAASAE